MYAATDALDCDEGVQFFSEKAKNSEVSMAEVYFFIRRPISEQYKHIFRRLARQSIVKTALKITSKGIRGNYKKVTPSYQIGTPEFDLDETIQHNPLNIYKNSLTSKDIIGIQKKKQKRKIVMILDTSG
ncbi:MAG: hypothetical protein ACTSSC_11975, partial [Promethearchaeota archaeon]